MDQRNGLELVRSIISKDAAIRKGGVVVLLHVVASLEGRRIWRRNITNAGNITWLHGYYSSRKSRKAGFFWGREERMNCFWRCL